MPSLNTIRSFMKYEKLSDNLDLFKTLADETRLRILCIIGKKKLTGVEILKQLDIAQPSLSFQMVKLVKSGLVNAEEKWKWTYYSVNAEKLKGAIKSFRILNDILK